MRYGVDTFFITDTRIKYENVTDRKINEKVGWLKQQFKHYGYFYQILHMLEAEGFKVEKDPRTLKEFPTLAKHHWYGRRGDLEFIGWKFNNGFEIEFFQSIVHENKSGGRYDFDKLKKMPYLIRLQYRIYMGKVVEKLKSLVDVDDRTRPEGKTAEEKIVIDLSCGFRMLPGPDFDLHKLDGTKPGIGYGWGNYEYDYKDRDGKPLLNGDFKYFRQHYSGVLMRGRVYYRANQQFWIITNDSEIELAYGNQLFDPTPADFARRRVAPDRAPKEFKERREKLAQAGIGELIKELKKRGYRIRRKG